ncbi:MAG: single-stranded DNA-binding protein [Clostridia bacterium]|nr:single-stranded DNA-binding protein [Clostridia bacterium]MBR2481123.1 single-stranded DNA-binding protein [Clostridia bacterium]
MNKVILIGNLTKDPEQSYTPSNICVCRFTVAVNRSYSSQNGDKQTDFLPVVCWRNQAENCAKHLKKGSKVGVSGSIQTRTYDDANGVRRYVTEIVADEVQFLSTRNENGSDDIPDIPEVRETRRVPRVEDARPVANDDDLPF